MNSIQVFDILARRTRRGRLLFLILFLVSSLSTAIAFLIPGGRPWAAAGFLASLLFCLGWKHVTTRHSIAKQVSRNPRIVYWAHPASPGPQIERFPFPRSLENRRLYMLLHLRDGNELEIALPPGQMHMFINWLTEQNPSVRLGVYDDEEPNDKQG